MRPSRLVVLLVLAAACRTEQPRPADSCRPVGDVCKEDGNCCSFGCTRGSVLQPLGICSCNPLSGGLCKTSNDCCSGAYCSEYQCVDGCRPAGDQCTYGSDCCTGTCGVDHTCACGAENAHCGGNSDCCAGLECAEVYAGYSTCCRGAAAPCTSDGQCCSGTCELTGGTTGACT